LLSSLLYEVANMDSFVWNIPYIVPKFKLSPSNNIMFFGIDVMFFIYIKIINKKIIKKNFLKKNKMVTLIIG